MPWPFDKNVPPVPSALAAERADHLAGAADRDPWLKLPPRVPRSVIVRLGVLPSASGFEVPCFNDLKHDDADVTTGTRVRTTGK